MEEPRGNSSAEEYRQIQGLAREGSYREALERAERALASGALGRSHAARLSSLACWLYTDGLRNPCPAAVLYGEDAIRISHLINDEWIRCEALHRLVYACVRSGDLERGRRACDQLAAELELNPAALEGGMAALWTARAAVDYAHGEDEACLAALDLALAFTEAGSLAAQSRLRALRAPALLSLGRLADLHRLLSLPGPSGDQPCPEWELAREALQILEHPGADGAHRAAALVQKAVLAGRTDLSRRLRTALEPVLSL